MIEGYKGMAEHNIVHRDIKLENFMIHNGKIKFCDFGMATTIKGED